MININQIIKEMDLEGDPSNHRVVVAMSGGVDSSVTAALLVEAGYQVVGLTMQLYDYGKALQKKGACCAGSDINDARLVSSKLGIPHYVLNYESIFQDQVMNDFADSYLRGETPIPCEDVIRQLNLQICLIEQKTLVLVRWPQDIISGEKQKKDI